ncbi:ras GTPase-activating protein raskol-like isoform X3 [Eriocheir sinensis]|uniref:ras GTPase-activating protein raskol-like isoform X3 n=1 Tax=Eriocheir sinensis TaxID=95602 RepID=UPI0021CA7013|nr:ras GTPase-activating protein raskol-like isoform X3 [Eriocheir sinensis]
MCIAGGVPRAEIIHPRGKVQCLGMASVLDAHGGVMDIVDAVAAPLLGFQGVVAGVTHGSQGSAPPSPKLPASSSAESTPKRNFLHQLHRFKKGAKNASKATATKGKTRGAESLEGGVDGLARAHSQENLHHSPLSHASSPLQSRPRIQDQDEKRRTENTLKIWIMEAKDIASKKKYFCHLIVDSQPSHRTCSKTMTNMCFWGEYFELDLNPETTTICIELKREGDKKSPKRIGSVEIDLKPSSPGRATLEEQWYAVKVDRPDKTCPALRIKHRFQSLDILPLSQYGPLRMYLKDNSTSLCQLLEPVVSVKAKEDIATTLINIMQVEDCAITFLVDLVYTDIQSNAENEHLLFRGNSVATKAIEAYMKLVGEQYLHDTLQEPIQALITSGEDLEVDHFKITNLQSLQEQRKSLKEQVTAVWEKILQSSRNFPVELRKVFHKLREKLSRQEKCELTDNLISSCVFLRFFCPAVLAPSLFNITTEYPDERANRNLTLVAKTLQTLANFTHFQGKESFMEFLNDFINKEQERCRTFLKAISSVPSPEDSHLEFDGKIDLGKHLALLHLHLADVLTEINTQGYESEASRVNALVDDISALLGGNHNEVSYARRPSSGPPLNASPALAPPHLHYNNNYTREECLDSVGEAGTGLVLPHATNRSQSFPRATTPVYANHHMVPGNQRQPFRHPERSAVNDLTNSEEFVLITAFDHSSRPQISMSLSEEANNNNTPAMDVRVTNSNTFYMSEASPAPIHHLNYQPQRALLHSTVQPRPHHRPGISRNLSVGGVPSPAERRRFEGHCSDLFRYMDDVTHKMSAICKDGENNIQGSQTSISQLSNIASSGYQSFAYSQSSSPVDSLLHTDNSSLLSRENGNPGLPVGIRQIHDSPLDPASERTSEEPPTATMTPRMT